MKGVLLLFILIDYTYNLLNQLLINSEMLFFLTVKIYQLLIQDYLTKFPSNEHFKLSHIYEISQHKIYNIIYQN